MSMKVLMVDSDWRFSGQAANFLESRAHHVVSEPRPRQAVAHAQKWQPDLALVAAETANLDVIKALYEMSPRPAVLVVGRMDRYDKAWQAWQTGGDELLMKPVFKAEELHDAIVTAMENRATGRRGNNQGLSATA